MRSALILGVLLLSACEREKSFDERYAEAAKEARMNNSREDIVTFTEAATRVQVLMDKLREHIEE